MSPNSTNLMRILEAIMNNLTLERVRIGLTQQQTAKSLNVSGKTLGKYEGDPLKAPGDFIVRTVRFYGYDASYLLGLTDERNAVVKRAV